MSELYASFQPTLTETGLKSLGLTLQQTSACELLKGIVHSYLQITATRPTAYPIIPDGSQSIYISPSGSLIGGAQSEIFEIPLPETGDYFGIRFYPAALRHFFYLDLAEITNQFADDAYFPCKQFSQLHTLIYRRQDFDKRAEVCEQWLLQQFKPHTIDSFDQALSLIYHCFGNIKVNQLSEKIGWSSRHINRLFRLHTGLSTQAFAQTIRIQQTCKQLFFAPDNSLNIAIERGYYDQSHLMNDFRKRLHSNNRVFSHRFMSDFYNK